MRRLRSARYWCFMIMDSILGVQCLVAVIFAVFVTIRKSIIGPLSARGAKTSQLDQRNLPVNSILRWRRMPSSLSNRVLAQSEHADKYDQPIQRCKTTATAAVLAGAGGGDHADTIIPGFWRREPQPIVAAAQRSACQRRPGGRGPAQAGAAASCRSPFLKTIATCADLAIGEGGRGRTRCVG